MDAGHVDPGSAVGHERLWVELDRDCDWYDLVLPRRERDLLQRVVAHLQQRDQVVRWGGVAKGVTLLFTGPPGTGKVLAARVIGADLDRPVFEVDLRNPMLYSGVDFAQMIGAVDAAAERQHAIIVFDGLEALVRERKISADRAIAAIDQALLQQRGYRRRGVVIITWSPGSGAAPEPPELADYVVDFPFPNAQARAEIWRNELPPGAQVGDSYLKQIARTHSISGGAIRSYCLAAAAAAAQEGVPVSQAHLDRVLDGPPPPPTIRGANGAGPAVQREPREVTKPRRERSAPPRRRMSARWPLAIVGGIAVAAAGFGVERLTKAHTRPPVVAKAASTSLLRVTLPPGWHQQAVPASVLPSLSGEVALSSPAPTEGTLILGGTQTPNTGLLPQTLVSALHTVPSPEVVTLGGVRFYRYSNLSPTGASSPETVYALPTTAGTVIGACTGPNLSPALVAACENVLATLKVSSGSPIAPGPSAAYASALGQVISKLSAARSTAASRLKAARTGSAQAAAAGALASAHAQAASALLGLKAGQASVANAALAHALETTSGVYAALARAAAQNNQRAYRSATAQLNGATAAIGSALAQLSKLGYHVAGAASS